MNIETDRAIYPAAAYRSAFGRLGSIDVACRLVESLCGAIERDAWALDNMMPERVLKGDTSWTEVSLVLEVPPKALRFAFGSGLKGGGRVWIGPITLESVDPTVPVTGH